MPIYNYRCEDCGTEFSKPSPMSPPEGFVNIAVCPNCKSQNSKKLVAKSSFSLKGKRWYKDGYS